MMTPPGVPIPSDTDRPRSMVRVSVQRERPDRPIVNAKIGAS